MKNVMPQPDHFGKNLVKVFVACIALPAACAIMVHFVIPILYGLAHPPRSELFIRGDTLFVGVGVTEERLYKLLGTAGIRGRSRISLLPSQRLRGW